MVADPELQISADSKKNSFLLGKKFGSPFTSGQHLVWKLNSIDTYITRKKYYLSYIHTESILSRNTHESAMQHKIFSRDKDKYLPCPGFYFFFRVGTDVF